MEKLNSEQKEKLALEILELLREYGLNNDLRIYFNNRCLHGDGTETENVLASDKFEYATNDTLSMSFEGAFYDVINYNIPSMHNEVMPKFSGLLKTCGLYYEQGHAWNLSTYYENPDAYADVEEEKEGDSHKTPIYIRKGQCPIELEGIRSEWEKRQIEHGNDGSCVIGAGFMFSFKGKYYRMPPQGPYQGSISWESSKDIIQKMLIAAGCEELSYDDGCLD